MKTRTLALILLTFAAATLAAQSTGTTQSTVPCNATGQKLPPIPELRRDDNKGVLRGTLYTVAEQVNMRNNAGTQCSAQLRRAYRLEAGPDVPPTSQLLTPDPGPTLRARVGDLVQLTFMNLVDANRFPNADQPCDQTSVYPGNSAFADKYPDCFHESVYTNMHYHGTHTSPSTTGDNVFLMIAPSPRARNQGRAPVVSEDKVKGPIDEFFTDCAAQLPAGSAPKQWPRLWTDFPKSWRDMQQAWLEQYYPKLWAANEKAILQGSWPQYYTGAYPYCFRLPAYTQSTWPPVKQAVALTPHSHGAGQAEADEMQKPQRPLIMGQSPGTHWYHAHKHGSTTINVMNGMTGAFIIEGKYDDQINAYYKTYGEQWTRKQPLMVINQLGSVPGMMIGGGTGPGPELSVNGAVLPKIEMAPGEVQMWRIVNSSSRAGVYFAAPASLTWKRLAADGVQVTQYNYDQSLNKAFFLAPGNRMDLLVQAPATAPSAAINVQVLNSVNQFSINPATAKYTTLMTVEVKGSASNMTLMPTVPDFPPFLATIGDEEVHGTKNVEFATGVPNATTGPTLVQPAQHTIDGKKFDGETGVVVGLNRVEEWKVSNASYGPKIAHPFHIHINPFQITEIFDPNNAAYVFTTPAPEGKCYINPLDKETWKPCAAAGGFVKPEERVWWDVFSIPPGKTVTASDGKSVNIPGYFKMRSRFVDYSGFFVLHCHILAHEDRGMMTVVQVAPLQTPYSHH